ARSQRPTRKILNPSIWAKPYRRCLRLGASQRVGLRFAASLGHRLGEVCEQHREPEPQRDLQVEAQSTMMRQNIPEQIDACNDTADLDHEHDWILHHRARTKL